MAGSKDLPSVLTLLLLAAVSLAFIQAASARIQTVKSEERFEPVNIEASNLIELQITFKVKGLDSYLYAVGEKVLATIDPGFIFPAGVQRTVWRVTTSHPALPSTFGLKNDFTETHLLYDVDEERFYGERIDNPYFTNWQLLQSVEDPRRYKLRVLPELKDAIWRGSDEPEIFYIHYRSPTDAVFMQARTNIPLLQPHA